MTAQTMMIPIIRAVMMSPITMPMLSPLPPPLALASAPSAPSGGEAVGDCVEGDFVLASGAGDGETEV